MSRSAYGHSPALDGVRGTAMVAFMAFHFGASGIAGAWVGINLFFVLSGFLITRLLIEEYHEHGGIDAVAFYRRRIRRLIPALLLLLTVVLVHGLLFAGGQRKALGWDILATLGYVMNWRLIATDDAYFDTFTDPSPLRHAWTLSIEEQFYVLVPLALLGLFALARKRWPRVWVLLAMAVVSAVWTAVLGLDDPATDHARLYYGTDVRAQSLFVGAALGTLLAVTASGRRYHLLEVRTAHILGWVALAATVVGFVVIDPFAGWMYNGGGMLLMSLVFAVLVMACQEEESTALTRFLGWAPFAHLGRLSYALYLWHWPVHLWLGNDRIGGSVLATAVVGMLITIAIAQLSWTYVEQPVIRRGIRGLAPRIPRRQRALAAALPVALVAVGALALTRAQSPAPAAAITQDTPPFDPAGLDVEAGPVQPLIEGQDEYTDAPRRIGVFGDSVPNLLIKDFPKGTYPGVSITDATVPGCDFFDLPVQWAEGTVEKPGAECRTVHRDFGKLLERDKAEVLVIFASPLTLAPHVKPEGTIVQAADPAYAELMDERLDTVADKAREAGVKQVQVVNVPCRELPSELPGGVQWQIFDRQPELRGQWEDPTRINGIVKEWVEGRDDAQLIDLDGALCSDGFQREVNGQPLYGDIVHFSPRSTPMLWTWLTGQISRGWEAR